MEDLNTPIPDDCAQITAKDVVKLATPFLVMFGCKMLALKMLRDAMKRAAQPQIVSYEEFKNSRDQYTHLYTTPSQN